MNDQQKQQVLSRPGSDDSSLEAHRASANINREFEDEMNLDDLKSNRYLIGQKNNHSQNSLRLEHINDHHQSDNNPNLVPMLATADVNLIIINLINLFILLGFLIHFNFTFVAKTNQQQPDERVSGLTEPRSSYSSEQKQRQLLSLLALK